MINSIEQGRKEDGSRSIADKIKCRLHDLQKTIENNLGRWAWELLQNAKDSISDEAGRDVCVQIELNNDSVIFRHNGAFFTELDIRGLINQISSKEVEEGEQTRNTGRFGTGFLTTHMLSRKVRVSSIVKALDDKFYSFNFLLDREGKTTADLAPKVELAWKGFQKSTQEVDSGYDENKFNTSFCYLLETDEQKDIANKGIVEFSKLIPYVLAFIPKLKKVEIIDNVSVKSVLFRNTNEIIGGLLSKIEKTENAEISEVLILQSKNDKVSIAIEVEKTERGYTAKDIKDIPKLFCDFPLIGSENFHFPVIVNSFFFNPLTERDGIWLKGGIADEEVLENQALLKSSVELYKNLIDSISEQSFYDLYNLATTKVPAIDSKYLEQTWYIENIQKPLRAFLNKSKIVEIIDGSGSIEEVFFPDTTLLKEDRETIWQFSSDLKVNKLPIKKHIQKWDNVIWKGCSKVDINDLVADLKGQKNISNLTKTLDIEEVEVFCWLNDCLKFINKNNTILFNESEIIPNQNGDFKACKELFLDEIEDEKLKGIAKLVGHDFLEELVHKNIYLEHNPSKKSINDIASVITCLINKENNTVNRSLAITMLIQWFEDNEGKGKDHFTELYRKKEKLLVDTIEDKESLFSILNSDVAISEVAGLVQQFERNPDKVNESIGKAKELDDLFAEYGAATVEELKILIVTAGKPMPEPSPARVEITQEILSSLGVTTPEELEIALQDESISEQFYHTSTPSLEMFMFAQEIIKRAKSNILKYLNEHQNYDCSETEDLAPTIIGGIVKNGQEITIVIRPSDNKHVIIYYDSEKATLEYESAELWIEDGKSEPKILTLGKVLRSTGITKIPV